MSERFSLVKKGYDPEEVDKYIENLEMVIKNYKEKDSAIKNALINAQITADRVVKDASVDALQIKRDVVDKLEGVSQSISAQRRKVLEFQTEYNGLMEKYFTHFNDRDIQAVNNKVDELEFFIERLKSDDGLDQTQKVTE